MLIRHSRMFVTQHFYLTLLLAAVLFGIMLLIAVIVATNDAPTIRAGSVAQVISPAGTGMLVNDRVSRGLDPGVTSREPAGGIPAASSSSTTSWSAGIGFDPGFEKIRPAVRSWGLNVGLDEGWPATSGSQLTTPHPYGGTGIGPTER